jgi:dTDP-glucose 4,6-dehydratase
MGEVINIGSGKDISIYEILNIVSKLINDNINIKTKIESKRVRPKKSEIQRLVCDYSKAQNLSGWKPKYTFEEGLKETIDWFKENLEIYKEGIYNV